MKSSFVFVLLLSFVVFGCSDRTPTPQDEAATATTVSVNVPTIQCGTCKANIEKALTALEGVKKADVNLDAKTVSVEFIPAKLSLAGIETAITLAGYDANDRKADPEAYEKLDACCKVPG